MVHEHFPENHPAVAHGKTGILLVNLGTPDDTSWWGIRRYLKEFLSDRRVIEAPRAIWWCVLNGIILTTRPHKTAHAYKKIWNTELDESPLRTITRAQAEKVAAHYAQKSDKIVVEWAMRYGNPSIASRLEKLKEAGCERIAVIALYPQYAAATTATVYDEVFRCLQKMRWQPALRTAAPYHDHPLYIEALAESVQHHIRECGYEPEVILASFHGLPVEYFKKGDPYHCHCAKTTRLLREELGMSEEKLRLTFQSRFGPKDWLQPYTDKTIEALGAERKDSIAVICPGFAADCVETLEEIAIEAKESWEEQGGVADKYSVIPCLNDSAAHIRLLIALAEKELGGWA